MATIAGFDRRLSVGCLLRRVPGRRASSSKTARAGLRRERLASMFRRTGSEQASRSTRARHWRSRHAPPSRSCRVCRARTRACDAPQRYMALNASKERRGRGRAVPERLRASNFTPEFYSRSAPSVRANPRAQGLMDSRRSVDLWSCAPLRSCRRPSARRRDFGASARGAGL